MQSSKGKIRKDEKPNRRQTRSKQRVQRYTNYSEEKKKNYQKTWGSVEPNW